MQCDRSISERITGFLGRNGAGKSTTIKMLLGMTHPTSGAGTVLGRSISNSKANTEMRREVAYVGQAVVSIHDRGRGDRFYKVVLYGLAAGNRTTAAKGISAAARAKSEGAVKGNAH
jgi:ABC-2 type transport system ATP-binding protein